MASTPRREPPEPTISELAQDALHHVQELIRSEIRLAGAEIREEASKALRAGAILAAGGVLGLYSVGFLLLTFVYALAGPVPPWLATLIIAVLVGAASGSLVASGVQRMRQVRSTPEKTIRTTKETVQWTKQQLK